jgi:hypothetical protein
MAEGNRKLTGYSAVFFALGLFIGMGLAVAVTNKAMNDSPAPNPTVTIIYDPATFQGLAATGGPVQVFPNNKATPYQGFPRWIIPGKVRPMVNGSSAGVTYSYFDLQKETYEGPFLPDVPQQRP